MSIPDPLIITTVDADTAAGWAMTMTRDETEAPTSSCPAIADTLVDPLARCTGLEWLRARLQKMLPVAAAAGAQRALGLDMKQVGWMPC